ncbi:MAG: alpha/beta family hydrolase [Candidatus Saccharimonadaceae bacterium]
MNLLILGGNSARHKLWIRQARDALVPYFDEVKFLDYKHWEMGEENTHITHEISEVGKLVADWDEYVVLAKSIGTVVATKAHAQGALRAKAYILLGLPLKGTVNQMPEFSKELQALSNISIYQNESDPFGGTKEVKTFLKKNEIVNIALIQTQGNTHDYLDFTKYIESIGDSF